jgi:hypothetical protein
MRLLIIAVSLLALSACSGGRSSIRADRSEYPISLSDGLRGADGALLAPGQKKTVGALEVKWSAWSMLWTLVPLSGGDRDISNEVNEQVKKAGGDAVVGMDVIVSQCGWNYMTFLGILPGCNHMAIRGDIVKVAR